MGEATKTKGLEHSEGKLSYEQLEGLANQMSQQLRQAKQQLGSMDNMMAIERMKFLFEVVKYESRFDSDFVNMCIEEIQLSLTVPEDSNNSSTNSEE